MVRTDDILAFDRATVRLSVRSKDADGRLHVDVSNISKASVNPYFGREMPGWAALGLGPDKVYQLYRDPAELAKAASTFNGVPVLNKHVKVSAQEPQTDLIIGSTGTDADFGDPYLRNSIVVWVAKSIELIESNQQKEISSAYRYRLDMTPGRTPDGVRYDGVMRDIQANHIAIVKKGRVGSDVVVGDSAINLRASNMKITSREAADKLRGMFAADASIDDIIALLDQLDSADPDAVANPDAVDTTAAAAVNPAAAVVVPAAAVVDPKAATATATDGDVAGQIRAIVGSKLSDDEIAKIAELAKPVAADTEAAQAAAAAAKPGEETVTKTAMDSAIAVAVKTAETNTVARLRGARDAEKLVAPYVGAITVAMDSAEDVLRAAFRLLGVDVKDVHPSAFGAILKAQPLPSARRSTTVIATDAAIADAGDDFAKRFPAAAKLSH